MKLAGMALALCVSLGAAGAATGADAAQTRGDGAQGAGKPMAGAVADKTDAERVPAGLPGRATTAFHRPDNRGISCVPYARLVTGMAITGNGWQWWGHAAGAYARGQRPEPGSVLAFRSASYMPHGHVAVVSRVVGSRHLLIDHANWAGPGIRRGQVMRNVSVVDVSEANDWTAVRVQSGHNPGAFGKVYATYGFIHNRPETTPVFTAEPARRRGQQRPVEVAEMPEGRPESLGATQAARRR
jgi:hypothetical protein